MCINLHNGISTSVTVFILFAIDWELLAVTVVMSRKRERRRRSFPMPDEKNKPAIIIKKVVELWLLNL